MSMKNSNDTSWDRISDLPICSTAHITIYLIQIQCDNAEWIKLLLNWEKKAWFHDKVSDILSPNCFFSSRVRRCTMESLTCVILHVRLEQCNVTCEQSWRWFVSSYERKIVVSVAVLSQGKRKKKNHMESYFFLSTSTKSRQNFMFEGWALLYVWETGSSNLGL